MSPLGAIVLAGGRSTRMGRDKASLPFGTGTLLSRVMETLAEVVDEIVLVVRHEQVLPPLPDLGDGVRVHRAHDAVEDLGPLGGLEAGLGALGAPVAYVSSCDVPFLSAAFVRAMLEALGERALALPLAEGRHHPLAGVYRREPVLPEVRRLLAEKRLRPVFLLERLAAVEVPEARLREVDPELDALSNCNAPEDYERARLRLAERDDDDVVVELYGIAAQRAGRSEVRVPGRTLRAVLRALGRAVPALEGEVLRGGALAPHWVASLDGKRFTADGDTPLAPGAHVLLLTSLSGG